MPRLTENAHLPRYPNPSSLRRPSMYPSFLGISEALHLGIFHQPLKIRFFDEPTKCEHSRPEGVVFYAASKKEKLS